MVVSKNDSSSLREFIRLSRVKYNPLEQDLIEVNVEVFESRKQRRQSAPVAPIISSVTQFVTIFTRSGYKFIIPRTAACLSNCIKTMLNGTYFESESGVVRLYDIGREVFEQIISYCLQELQINSHQMLEKRKIYCTDMQKAVTDEDRQKQLLEAARINFGVEMSPEYVMELLMACHFLDVPGLMDITCKMLAEFIEGIDSLEGVPEDAAQQIYSHLSPRALAGLEAKCSHDQPLNILNTKIASSQVWKASFIRNNWHADRDSFIEAHYLPPWFKFLRDSGIQQEFPIFSDIARPVQLEADEHIDWKTECIQRDFQQFIDALNEGMNAKEMKQVIRQSKNHIKYLKVPRSFKDLLQSLNVGEESTSSFLSFTLIDFIKNFNNLELLDISNCSLNLLDIYGLVTTIPTYNIRLQSLILANAMLNDEHLRILCRLFKSHSLQYIDISENIFTDTGLLQLSFAVNHCTDLKYLSIENNHRSLNVATNVRGELLAHYRLPHWERWNPQSSQCTPALAHLNSDIFPTEQELTEIKNIENLNSTDSLFSALTRLRSVILLNMGLNALDLTDSASMAVYFSTCPKLQYLLLSRNKLTNVDRSHPCVVPTNIRFLDFSFCRLNRAYVQTLIEAINDGQHQVQSLNLSGNRLYALAQIGQLVANSTLVHLDLSSCSLRENNGMLIAEALDTIDQSEESNPNNHSGLRVIILSNNHLGDSLLAIARAAQNYCRKFQDCKLHLLIDGNSGFREVALSQLCELILPPNLSLQL